MKHTLYTILLLIGLGFFSETQAQHFRVYFHSKGLQSEKIQARHTALSQKALKRRSRLNIPLDWRDVSLNQTYITQLQSLGGNISAQSRWFNFVVVDGLDQVTLESLPFVKKVEAPKPYKLSLAAVKNCDQAQSLNYGLAAGQIEMLRGHKMHELGFLGQGMTIAVLDGGFSGVESAVAFDSLWLNNRIMGTYNFVNKDTNVFVDGSHGSKVLSIMGGYLDNQLIGSAPRADYWLLKSEQESDETPVEMDYWLMAAEFADSVGVDIISSSLGYNEFRTGFDYEYSDMDGNTTVVTKAADMAAQKGILVIVSAGNEGSNSWEYITAPADGDSVMAVGAVNSSRNRASFSSKGPSADGRIKPDVMATGSSTAYASGGMAFTGNGTSFSCPIVSGLAACLWQANPSMNNMDIMDEIRKSADRYFNPDNEYGYGIPNFEHAFYQIGLDELWDSLEAEVFPNPIGNELRIRTNAPEVINKARVIITDLAGNELLSEEYALENSELHLYFPFTQGIYILNLTIGECTMVKKILK